MKMITVKQKRPLVLPSWQTNTIKTFLTLKDDFSSLVFVSGCKSDFARPSWQSKERKILNLKRFIWKNFKKLICLRTGLLLVWFSCQLSVYIFQSFMTSCLIQHTKHNVFSIIYNSLSLHCLFAISSTTTVSCKYIELK